MKSVKKIIALIAAFMMVCVVVIGCTAKPAEEPVVAETSEPTAQSSQPTDTGDQLLFGASFLTLNNVFYNALSNGIKEYVESRGGKYIATDAQTDLQKQTADVEDLIQMGCNVIFVAPIDSAGSAPAAVACQAAGIPLICVNSPIDHAYVSATVETDNYLAGVLMAQSLIELTGGEAKVGMLEYNIIDAGRGRTDGFLDTIKNQPKIEVVARQECDTTTEGALPIAEDMLQSNPEITAFFCVNDPTAYGVYAAAEAVGRKDNIVIVSCDGGSDVVEWIKSGKIKSTSAQYPKDIGLIAAEAGMKLLNGEKIEPKIQVEAKTINAGNVGEYEAYLKENGLMD